MTEIFISKTEKLVHKQLGRLGIATLYISHHGEGSLLEFVNGIEDFWAVKNTKGNQIDIV